METPITSVSPEMSEYTALCNRLRVGGRLTTSNETAAATGRSGLGRTPMVDAEALRILQERAVVNLAMIAHEAGAEIARPESFGNKPSPDSVAKEVLSFGSSVFDAWRQCCTDLSDAEARAEFARLMSDALDSGFRETRAILNGLHDFYSDLESISDFMTTALGRFTK